MRGTLAAIIAVLMTVVGVTTVTADTTNPRKCRCSMPGRLLYKETTRDTLVSAINPGLTLTRTLPLGAQPRPDHPWSISGLTFTAHMEFTPTLNAFDITVTLVVGSQRLVLFSRRITDTTAAPAYVMDVSENVLSANYTMQWTDGAVIEVQYANNSSATIQGPFGNTSVTVGLLGTFE